LIIKTLGHDSTHITEKDNLIPKNSTHLNKLEIGKILSSQAFQASSPNKSPLPKKTLKNPLTEKGRIDILDKCRGEKTTHGN
jgi:hypothetical protein